MFAAIAARLTHFIANEHTARPRSPAFLRTYFPVMHFRFHPAVPGSWISAEPNRLTNKLAGPAEAPVAPLVQQPLTWGPADSYCPTSARFASAFDTLTPSPRNAPAGLPRALLRRYGRPRTPTARAGIP
ncbi:hypothetical protein SXIM_16570 [Streptomyces xiamenensis]|uniref:Uncharacterized protein n=1 Tax=Streptomyces xiamenensis TaxID=408015 RepID=A0A0F7CNJ9_9ACTN|nr:hypothetical protein SXIM_16570 [Streptomyces xiamenensis]